MPKKILIINKAQFGYHTDYYKYCEYLRDEYNVTYLCFDSGHEKLVMEDVKVKYVSNKGSRTVRGVRFILQTLVNLFSFKGIVFIHYFEKCELLKRLFPKKKMVLDIKTLNISPNLNIRQKYDNALKKATSYFDFVTIISEGLRNKLGLNHDKSAILPLGADVISTVDKDFGNEIKLLYVGTLNGRNIDQTILGLSLFLENNPEIKKITYDIIGDGDKSELSDLKVLIEQNNLNDIVRLHGRIPHFKLKPFFDSCNVGVSYVPITNYYNHQPPTKTYEYILSGLFCIATSTHSNKELITEDNGILIEDNPEEFANALEFIHNNKNFDSDKIRNTLLESTWKGIIDNILIPILNKT